MGCEAAAVAAHEAEEDLSLRQQEEQAQMELCKARAAQQEPLRELLAASERRLQELQEAREDASEWLRAAGREVYQPRCFCRGARDQPSGVSRGGPTSQEHLQLRAPRNRDLDVIWRRFQHLESPGPMPWSLVQSLRVSSKCRSCERSSVRARAYGGAQGPDNRGA